MCRASGETKQEEESIVQLIQHEIPNVHQGAFFRRGDLPDSDGVSKEGIVMIVQLKLSTPLDMMKELLHPESGPDTRELYEMFRKYQKQIIAEYRKTEEAPRLGYALTSSALQWILRLTGEE